MNVSHLFQLLGILHYFVNREADREMVAMIKYHIEVVRNEITRKILEELK